jgi:hypothetical protein
MASYEVVLRDRTVEIVDGADAYQQEGPMTTFFATGAGRRVVDCWSTRLASFRTGEVLLVRRLPDCDGTDREPAGSQLGSTVAALRPA